MSETLNIVSALSDWRAQQLSNFARTPFHIRGEIWCSVEGFIQGIKFPEDDPRRKELQRMSGPACKGFSQIAQREFGNRCIFWQGKEIPYRSPEHVRLIKRALRQKFANNPRARSALILSAKVQLTHDLGHPESPHTSLPAAEFIRMLEEIREELQSAVE